MKRFQYFFALTLLIFSFMACIQANEKERTASVASETNQKYPLLSLTDTSLKKVVKTNASWKKILTTDQYFILREKGTERPFQNKYNDNHKKGHYFCAGCKLPLFSSKTKFNSGTGWPSFYAPINSNRVKEVADKSLGMVRGEIVCARCDGHLGHLFDDGPNPTGLRYCMNSASLLFQESK